jgi:hypothetical protein
MRSVDGPQADRARLEAASRWRVLGEKWSANLAAIREDGTPVELVVFTGDLGDWGHPTDYPRALAFLTQTCEVLAVPIERLFVIPGNHDIDRTVQRAAWESLRRDVARDPHAWSRWLAGEDRRALRGDDRRDQICGTATAGRTSNGACRSVARQDVGEVLLWIDAGKPAGAENRVGDRGTVTARVGPRANKKFLRVSDATPARDIQDMRALRQLAVRTLIQGRPIMRQHQVLSIDDWHALLAAS